MFRRPLGSLQDNVFIYLNILVSFIFQEQEKIAKTGLEMKLATSEMEAETERWQDGVLGGPNVDENNDIVKRARNMSRMALSMYQFTKGDGPLKTTQDLFTQAEYFAEEANRLYKVVRQFSYQVSFLISCSSSSWVLRVTTIIIYIFFMFNKTNISCWNIVCS